MQVHAVLHAGFQHRGIGAQLGLEGAGEGALDGLQLQFGLRIGGSRIVTGNAGQRDHVARDEFLQCLGQVGGADDGGHLAQRAPAVQEPQQAARRRGHDAARIVHRLHAGLGQREHHARIGLITPVTQRQMDGPQPRRRDARSRPGAGRLPAVGVCMADRVESGDLGRGHRHLSGRADETPMITCPPRRRFAGCACQAADFRRRGRPGRPGWRWPAGRRRRASGAEARLRIGRTRCGRSSAC